MLKGRRCKGQLKSRWLTHMSDGWYKKQAKLVHSRWVTVGVHVYLEVSHASSHCLMETRPESQETRLRWLTKVADNSCISNRGTVWTEVQG